MSPCHGHAANTLAGSMGSIAGSQVLSMAKVCFAGGRQGILFVSLHLWGEGLQKQRHQPLQLGQWLSSSQAQIG